MLVLALHRSVHQRAGNDSPRPVKGLRRVELTHVKGEPSPFIVTNDVSVEYAVGILGLARKVTCTNITLNLARGQRVYVGFDPRTKQWPVAPLPSNPAIYNAYRMMKPVCQDRTIGCRAHMSSLAWILRLLPGESYISPHAGQSVQYPY